MRGDGPTLTTDRLRLVPPRPEDLDDSVALWGDPAVMAFIGDGRPLTAEEVWSRLLRQAGTWLWCGFGYWTVRTRTTGRYVGTVGFQNLKRAIVPPLGDDPEIGWLLVPAMQGHGFAGEAIAAALGWADRQLAATTTVCIIRPAHERSIRLAAAAGYAPVGTALYGGATIGVFARPRPFPSADRTPTS